MKWYHTNYDNKNNFKKVGNRDRKRKNYGSKIEIKKQVGKWNELEWKQVKNEAQGLLNVEQKLILMYLLSLFWLLCNQPL